MPMGIVSDEDYQKELDKCPKKEDGTAKILPINRGRGHAKETPAILRRIIGETAITENNKEVSEAFGVSPSSVSAYKHGANSTNSYNNPDPVLNNHITNRKAKIGNSARKRLMMALKHIDDDKLSQCGVRVLSGVARDMAAVMKDMEPPKQETPTQQFAQFVFMAPRQKEEKDYPVIQVVD